MSNLCNIIGKGRGGNATTRRTGDDRGQGCVEKAVTDTRHRVLGGDRH